MIGFCSLCSYRKEVRFKGSIHVNTANLRHSEYFNIIVVGFCVNAPFFPSAPEAEHARDDQRRREPRRRPARRKRVDQNRGAVEPRRGRAESGGKEESPEPRRRPRGQRGALVNKLSPSPPLSSNPGLPLRFAVGVCAAARSSPSLTSPQSLSFLPLLPNLPRFWLLLSSPFKPRLRADGCGGLSQLSPAHRSESDPRWWSIHEKKYIY